MDVLSWIRDQISEWRRKQIGKNPPAFCCAKRNDGAVGLARLIAPSVGVALILGLGAERKA